MENDIVKIEINGDIITIWFKEKQHRRVIIEQDVNMGEYSAASDVVTEGHIISVTITKQ